MTKFARLVEGRLEISDEELNEETSLTEYDLVVLPALYSIARFPRSNCRDVRLYLDSPA